MFGQNSLFHLCADPRFEFVLGDVRDEDLIRSLVKDADVIIPLAAIVGAPACQHDPWMAKSVNLEAICMINRLRSLEQLVIYPTTNSGYGTKSSETYCTEDTPLEPISLYGQTKVQAEQELLEKPNAITLRLATVFGMSPRMRLDLLVNHFTYAAVMDGYNAGLETANLSKEELALKIKEFVPDFYIHFSEVGTDPDRRNYIVSNQRLKETGFEARRSLPEGIQELLKGYRMLGRAPFKNV